MFRYLYFLIFINGLVFSQNTKNQIKKASKIVTTDFSKEHLTDFKLVMDMFDSSKKINTVRYTLKSIERVQNKMASATTKVKIQMQPRKVYLINVNNKLEILYNENELNDKCLVKPHVFPYFTMTLYPLGNLMRKNQHFTILDVGFDFAVKTIAIALSKEKGELGKHLSNKGKVEKNGRVCYLMIYENDKFSYDDYVVQKRETVSSIAAKFTVNDYMIRTKNNLYDNYGYLKEGALIYIPNYYCRKAIFYIDEKTMLPISLNIYDEVGFFESYDFYDIKINEQIPEIEFTRNFKEYRF
jgi:hypothetical protein